MTFHSNPRTSQPSLQQILLAARLRGDAGWTQKPLRQRFQGCRDGPDHREDGHACGRPLQGPHLEDQKPRITPPHHRCPPPPPPPIICRFPSALFTLTTILPDVVGRMTAKREAAGSTPYADGFSACTPSYWQLWALWVPGEEPWGRSKAGEESQEDQMSTNPSLSVRVQSAEFDCKRTVKKPVSFLSFHSTCLPCP